ncbi:DUF5076 domain-containing protein [Ralstonia solanacearum]|uniref:DUF5076 domain-containing protein n=1 Tax=Ralstonia solanacearum TaxID=305 RepID=UPI00078B4151|nr:DUF5076 domain-containing protein [Ralstonia solanacearum]AMP39297.1 hypothetical protein LBM2029_16870 [Ralstonia solanacearum]AXV88132.1 DUF5076 domain-containing protein [Ralstonia solanacearum]AXW07617.1 DUF5076 domain-containing protein [Ralstonia solanacearum]AXW25407.1 DUF5076 domain-containing protein [Ralstonia solanacearum]AXW82319.1 DUF5076 domain-containing protein [Ralstonia solanacearum]
MTHENLKLNQLPIPEAALRDTDAVEMLRMWIAEHGLHCSLKIGRYHETTEIPKARAWGIILADAARHVANAMESEYSLDAAATLQGIIDSLLDELNAPTSEATGGFQQSH